MKVLKNTSDLMRQQFLNNAVAQMQITREAGDFLPFAGIYNELHVLRDQFRESCLCLNEANGLYLMSTQAKNDLAQALNKTVHDFLVAVGRRSRRLGHPKYLAGRFRVALPLGKFPSACNLKAWAIVAKSIIKADKNAVAEGYPAMVNPSAGDLQQLVDREPRVFSEHVDRRVKFKEAQQEVKNLRDRVDHLSRVLLFYLRGWLLEKKPSTARVIMGQFGYRFRSIERRSESGGTVSRAQAPETTQTEPTAAPADAG